MILGPIARRELLVTARNPLTYRGRWIIALVVFVVGGGIATLFSFTPRGAVPPGSLLSSLSFYIFLYCLAAGAQSTADSLSREKRDGTLGLLFLTTLKSREIISGKLVAGGISTLYGLMATFPILSIIVLHGGVEYKDLAQLFLAALNAMFVAACIGLFASTHAFSRKQATAWATWSVLILWFALPGLAELSARYPDWVWLSRILKCLSISHSFRMTAGLGALTGFDPYYHRPWMSLAGTHLLGWFFLLLATFYLPRKWQDQPVGTGKGLPWRDRLRQWTYGNPKIREARRHRLLNRNPFLWLSSRDRFRPLGSAFVLVIMSSFFLLPIIVDGWDEDIVIPYVIAAVLTTKLTMCGSAPQKMMEELENGTLEMILSTPLGVRDVIKGQIFAMWEQFRWVLVYLALLLTIAPIYLISVKGSFTAAAGIQNAGWDNIIAAVIVLSGFLGMIVLDFFAIAMLGLWGPLTVKNLKHAAGAVMLRGFFLPPLFFMLGSIAAAILDEFYGIGRYFPAWSIPLAYYLGSFLLALFWIIRVWRKLPTKLRESAFKRYTFEEKRPWWRLLIPRKKALPVLS